MKTAAFIPIKSNSERVKGKNFSKLCGRKLYEHIIMNSIAAECFDSIYVDTDSEEIKKYCCDKGVLIIDREPRLTSNCSNGNDLLNHHRKECPDYDLYFQLFATAPFLKPETIADCVCSLKNTNEYDSIFTVTQETGWFWLGGVPVNFRPGILPRSQDSIPVFKETTGLYGITSNALDKYCCRVGAKPNFYEVSKIESIDLDTPDDFKFAGNFCNQAKTTLNNPYIYDDE